MPEFLEIFGEAIWFILPAYIANSAPVVLGGGQPIDGGKVLSDGRRILGDGKTIRGLIAGIIAGILTGLLQALIWGRLGAWEVGILLTLGALLGDIVGSFLKRRAGLKRGRPVPILDQLEFIGGALLLGSIVFKPTWEIVTVLLICTPFIHLGTNFVGYKMGFKKEPY